MTIFLLSITIQGCAHKNSVVIESGGAETKSAKIDEEEIGDIQAVGNSIVLAQLLSKNKLEGAPVDSPCYKVDCIGTFEIKAFIQYGGNFHGQLTEGQVVVAEFEFTLSESSEAFPELNEPLPGIAVGDFFEAELFENVDDGKVSIRLYDVKK